MKRGTPFLWAAKQVLDLLVEFCHLPDLGGYSADPLVIRIPRKLNLIQTKRPEPEWIKVNQVVCR